MPYKDPERKRVYDAGRRKSGKKQAADVAWRKANPDKVRAHWDAWGKSHPNEVLISKVSYRQRHPDKIRDTEKRYLASHPNALLAKRLRHRVNQALKGYAKSAATLELLGCALEELRVHLEVRFVSGMTWDNYGQWHIDHIRPCASFDLTDPEQQRQCFHYTNLQPLWAADNLRKGAR
jgi:hypothetical protein